MKEDDQLTRRQFIKTTAIAGVCVGSVAVPRLSGTELRSSQVNVGLIGVGIRGHALHKGINESRHARLGGIADVSEHYIDRIRPELLDSRTPIYRDYRKLLDDKSINAVVIASPDHWHAQMTLDALDAGKDVYVEKPLAYSFDEAVRVREKARQTGRINQVGYQRRTLEHFHKARSIVQSGVLGEITQVQLWSSRNRETAPWRAYDDYNNPGLPAKSGPEHVDWKRFQSNRPPRPYDPHRFFHWQCYEEYSTGIFGILMSHPLDAANLVLDLDIPETCYATGGIFRYDDGRTVPDTCNALFNYPSRNLTVSFAASSNNAFFNQEAHYRGTHGTMELGPSWLRIYAETRNALFDRFVTGERSNEFTNFRKQPILDEPVYSRWSTLGHLDNFFDCVKSRTACKAPITDCFKAMVAVSMSIQSYKSRDSVKWDPATGRILM